jgi:hypothetical protein
MLRFQQSYARLIFGNHIFNSLGFGRAIGQQTARLPANAWVFRQTIADDSKESLRV